MNVYTSEQMRKLEKEAFKAGISPLTLMENAAIGVCNAIIEFYGSESGSQQPKSSNSTQSPIPNIVILCGRGNNGGDGMALARHLAKRGIEVKALLAKGEKPLSPESETNRKKLKKSGIPLYEFSSLDGAFKKSVQDASLVVDCLFGTGLSRNIEGVHLEIIKLVNKLKKRVIAVDMPSGINSDTGEIMGDALKAELTVALGAPKPGHLLFPGRGYCGALKVVDISLPESSYKMSPACNWLREDEVKSFLKKRAENTHKGSYGHLAVIGGSPGKTGAPCMAGMAAMRSGAGLATVICSESLNPIFEARLLEVMTLPVDDVDGYISQIDLSFIRDFLKDKNCLVIGPGLSTNPVTERLFVPLFQTIGIPAVIDADALNLLAKNKSLLNKKTKQIVLTPHPGEMARLTGKSAKEALKNSLRTAVDFAKKYAVYLILKSATTIMATPDGAVYISTYGNPGMASAGTGDALSGIIGSFIAQGYPLEEAAQMGIVLHGIAGDRAKEIKGEYGLIASDIIELLPHILKNWEEGI